MLTEPDPFMARRLRDRVERETPAAGSVEVIEASAESLPFDDDSFDTVVSTLVLCTVDDPDRAARRAVRACCVPAAACST